MASPEEHIRTHLLTNKHLPVSPDWLSQFISQTSHQQQRGLPLAALTQTALFRILNSNFTESLSTTSHPTALLPHDIANPIVKERLIRGPVPVQVLDIEDIGSSLWSQVEAIERVDRGETVRGREIIRNVSVGDGDDSNAGGPSGNAATANGSTSNSNAALGSTGQGPHRLTLQDAAGTQIVALELRSVEGIAIGKLPIGAKMVLRNVIVGRGMVLLTPDTVIVLGGKIEHLDAEWRRTRKANLLARLEEQRENASTERLGD